MYLVHPKKGFVGKWEVAWTWLPYFIASDRDLIRAVDQALTEEFKGSTASTMLEGLMDKKVRQLILTKYPFSGLKAVLESYQGITLEEESNVTTN